MIILPYYNLLKVDFIEINESEIKDGELYEDYFYNFFHDYERNNPITKKEGIKHFLDKLLEKVLITKNDYDTILQNYEEMNLLEIYYKSKLHFGYNLLKRAFSNAKNIKQANNNLNNLFNDKKVDIMKNGFKSQNNNKNNDKKESEDTKEKQNKSNGLNDRKRRKSLINKKGIILNSNNQNKIKEKKGKTVIYYNQRINGTKIKKNIIKPDSDSKRNLMHSNRKTIENEENNGIMNINIKNFLKK